MSNEDTLSASHYEFLRLIERASRGNRCAADLFYRVLLSTTFYVPERRGAGKLSEGTRYPDSLFSLLGVTVKDTVYIPFFLEPTFTEQWCGFPLSTRTMTGSHLFSLAPQGWWLCLNPGQNIEKEFSPWEIALLQKGSEAIPELVEELVSESSPDVVTAVEPEDDEFIGLKEAIVEVAEEHPEIEKVFLLKEVVQNSGVNHSVPLVGITLEGEAGGIAESILSTLRSAAQLAQMGGEEPKLYVGVEGAPTNIALKLFEFSTPFYTKTTRSSVFSKSISFFSRTFR